MGEAFLWGLVAGSSLLLGALVVRVWALSESALGLIMGFGAGVLISAVAFELVEEAAETGGEPGWVTAGFFAGALTFYAGDVAISRMGYANRKNIGDEAQSAGPLAIVLGIVLDGVPESAVIGLTVLTTGEVGVAVLVAVFISNLPESVAATSGLRAGGWAWSRLSLLWGGMALISALAAATGYAALDGASSSVIAFVLAFAGGAVLTMLASTMMPEAYEHARQRVGLATSLGFAVAFAITWLAD